MTVFKTTVGFVTQTFDTATGKCTHQEFVAGEQVDWEHGDEKIEAPDNCPDHPLEMIQPIDWEYFDKDFPIFLPGR